MEVKLIAMTRPVEMDSNSPVDVVEKALLKRKPVQTGEKAADKKRRALSGPPSVCFVAKPLTQR